MHARDVIQLRDPHSFVPSTRAIMSIMFFSNLKLFSLTITLLIVAFLVLDMYLYFTVTSYPQGTTLPLSTNKSESPCFISPFCLINVKSLLMDPPNFYVHIPLSKLLSRKLELIELFKFVSANAISLAHVPIALIASKLISQDSLCMRRVGVVLFEVRNFLDALDGSVARSRRNQVRDDHLNYAKLQHQPVGTSGGVYSEVLAVHRDPDKLWRQRDEASAESLGFWLDGISDGVGCIFLFTACFFYLQRHPVKRSLFSYNPLPLVLVSMKRSRSKDPITPAADVTINYTIKPCSSSNGVSNGPRSPKYIVRHIIRSAQRSGLVAISFGFQTLLGSIAWNRCIANLSGILEVPKPEGNSVRLSQELLSAKMLHSPFFWFVVFIWRYINPHAWLEGLLVAIFFDKMGEFLSFFRFLGFFVILVATGLTEIYIYDLSQHD